MRDDPPPLLELAVLNVDDVADPFALVRLDGDTLTSDPARLVDEATTMPLFGGRRGGIFCAVGVGSAKQAPGVGATARQVSWVTADMSVEMKPSRSWSALFGFLP